MNSTRAVVTPLTVIAALTLTACGNTAINVAGRQLDPVSADLFLIGGVPYFQLSDIPDFCTKVKAQIRANPCGGSEAVFAQSGTFLTFAAFGAYDGAKLNVVSATQTSGSSSYYGRGASAYASFQVRAGQTQSFAQEAIYGTVTIESFRANQIIAGTYDLTFTYGEHEQGHFAARYCDVFDQLPTGAGSCQAPECAQYIRCANAQSSGSGDALLSTYGPSGTCWTSTSATSTACRDACVSALNSARSGSNTPSACY
jgi:hypothetical protein